MNIPGLWLYIDFILGTRALYLRGEVWIYRGFGGGGGISLYSLDRLFSC